MMKTNLLILSATFALTVNETLAQEIPQSQVPSLIVNNFQQSFPKTTDVEWEIKGELFKVEFEKGLPAISHDVWYDKTGKLVKHKENISNTDLPQKLAEKIKRDYSPYQIDDAKKITEGNKITYSFELKNSEEEWEVIFDSEGTLLSKIAD